MKRHLFAAAAALALSGCATMGAGDWTTLIDNDKGLDNFTRDGDANWRAQGGAIVADQGKGGFLVSKQSFGDYQLRIEFFPDHNTNSGIYMRCSVREKLTDKLCHEANIFDERPDPTFGTGGIVHLGKVLQPVKAGGKWNTYDITVQGDHLVVVFNGVTTVDVHNAKLAGPGPVGLQWGRGTIKWRKVAIRAL
jgi:hypothetical protein